VTLEGKPVAGQVIFIWDDKKELSSPIGPQGNYTIPEPPAGKVKVLVKSMTMPGGNQPLVKPKGGPEMADPLGGGGMGGAAPPAKYGAVNTTPLSFEVTSGRQTYDIPLAP
jgi:hypothetical protein